MVNKKNKTRKLTQAKVKHIAKLADLRLSPSEIKAFSKQLSEVLSYVDKLQELYTTKVEPTSQVTGLKNVFREDVVEQSLTQEEALSNAKKAYKGYFVTKGIFDKA